MLAWQVRAEHARHARRLLRLLRRYEGTDPHGASAQGGEAECTASELDQARRLRAKLGLQADEVPCLEVLLLRGGELLAAMHTAPTT